MSPSGQGPSNEQSILHNYTDFIGFLGNANHTIRKKGHNNQVCGI